MKTTANEGQPFGEKCREALEAMLEIGKKRWFCL